MAFSPGKNVGRVSIRVVPDTTRFRNELRRQLATVEKTTSMTVRVDKARVDRNSMRESIRRQMATFNDLDVASKVRVTVDSARVKRGAVRKSIQEQFDRMGDVRVYIQPKIHKKDEEKFKQQVRRMVDNAKSTVNIGVNAHTAAASAQMRYVTRPRWVDIFVRVNKASIAKALTTLAALSGARLSYKWIDSLIEKARVLDKNLPAILNWTSGITALIAAVAGSVSGLVGIGQGLFAITPALLVLPGLLLNAVGSLTVFIVALRHAKDELSVLGDDMNELGEIIRTTFWDNARQPIIDLVQGLMPQLRNAFRELSQGVGEFSGAMARAFGEELANGRLEGIFAGIAEGWRILGSGASGFAGALVSLSEIAARYTPRLASWFVRQANTFDAWLTAIATDRRLDRWMEDAIDAMYDVWDVTRGISGVFAGIWRAADAAGSTGLAGFARLMLTWRDVVNSVDFQRGLEAVFRGSYVAMDAFGDAIKALGRLFSDMPRELERFIGSAGGFLGGVLEGAFDALNNVSVSVGLDQLSQGFEDALAGILPSLDPIAATFGDFLGLLGDLAGNVLPFAARTIADLTPAISGIIDAIEPVLPGLVDAADRIARELGPAIEDFVEAASPLFQQIISELAIAIADLTPVLVDLVYVLGDLVEALGNWAEGNKGFFEGIGDFFTGGQEGNFRTRLLDLGVRVAPFDEQNARESAQAIADIIVDEYEAVLDRRGPAAGARFTEQLRQIKFPPEVKAALEEALDIDFESNARAGGGGFSRGLSQGITEGLVGLNGEMKTHGENAMSSMDAGMAAQRFLLLVNLAFTRLRIVRAFPGGMLTGVGGSIMDGLAAGIRARAVAATVAAVAAVHAIVRATRSALQINSPSRVMAKQGGQWVPAGIAAGIDQNRHLVERSARAAVDFNLGSGPTGSGRYSAGTVVNVTQPLLPGETPQEQRDNLVKELQWAL